MYQSLNGFFASWEFECDQTKKLFQCLSDEALQQKITADDRDLGRIAWHLIISIKELMNHTGLNIEAPEEEEIIYSASVIIQEYENTCESLKKEIYTQWTDQSLQEKNSLFGKEMPNRFFLMTLIRHQIHHRGQITVLMRQAGLNVPGIYGPSREEWGALGMKVPKV
ncbi:DinB family protein [Halobacillus salinarum]|uniref:DinB family protein n=1 Tax=Halobacillus salinarum TaxID=2932257 RepID=A0ABY4EIM3_9BACI|nr:DinB family protein [Halobacillus salinarum]UOQ43903.1 DinB family protein [Halobacillus salinarum]